jgi:hypothetical protein
LANELNLSKEHHWRSECSFSLMKDRSLGVNKIPEERTAEPRHPASMNRMAPEIPGLAIATRKMTVERMNPVLRAKCENSVMW